MAYFIKLTQHPNRSDVYVNTDLILRFQTREDHTVLFDRNDKEVVSVAQTDAYIMSMLAASDKPDAENLDDD